MSANQPGPGPGPEPAPSPGFEVPGAENPVLARLGESMHFVGLFGLALGLLSVAAGVTRRDALPIAYGVLFVLTGFWTTRAGGRFRSVALTRGHDLAHLHAALEDLRRLYGLQYWLCLAALAAAVLLLFTPSLY